MGLTAEERREYEAMRDRIAQRISELDDKVSYGTLSPQEADAQLREEFGDDYYESLSALNNALHSKQREHEHLPHAAFAATLLFVLGAVGVLAALVYPGVTGSAALGEQTVNVQTVLEHQETVRLGADTPIAVTEIDASSDGTERYTIIAHDATGEHELARTDPDGLTCTGCDERLEPPYMLEVRTPGGEVHLKTVTYRSVR